MKVRDAMTANVLTIRPEASLKEAVTALAGQPIGGLPGIDPGGAVVGVVTDADIVLKEGASRRGGLRRLFHRDEVKAVVAKVEARTVGEAMSTPAITGDARQSASGMRCERLLAPVLQRWANSTSSELVVWLGRREGGGSQDAADRVQMLPSRACCRASPHENRLFKPKMRAVELEVRAGEGGPFAVGVLEFS
jgi:CBS domain-containing protein